MSEQGKKTNWQEIKLVAVWGPKSSKGGKEYYTGKLKVSQLKKFVAQMTDEEKEDGELGVMMWKNNQKKADNQPEFEMYRQEPTKKKETVKTTDSWGDDDDNLM